MVNIDIFFIVAAVGYSFSVICFIAGIVIFFRYNILYVIKDLNGTIKQKEISVLRKKLAAENSKRARLHESDKSSGKLTGRNKAVSERRSFENHAVPGATNFLRNDTEMKTSILEFNKAVSKDFIIVTDIIFINTEETI